MNLKRTAKVGSYVPTASMADIAFLLLIFFMCTTIFRMEEGMKVTLPRAETVTRQQRERILRVWIDATGTITIQDKFVRVDQIKSIIGDAIRQNPLLVVAFNADRRTPSGVVHDVIEQLKEANAVRVSFTSEPEAGGTP
jgi:biopolymer transport protein ExbD